MGGFTNRIPRFRALPLIVRTGVVVAQRARARLLYCSKNLHRTPTPLLQSIILKPLERTGDFSGPPFARFLFSLSAFFFPLRATFHPVAYCSSHGLRYCAARLWLHTPRRTA